MNAPSIRFEGVSVRFGAGKAALDDVTFEVPAGAFTVLLGASGAGKSTLLRALLGFVPLSAGQIAVDGRPQSHADLLRQRRRIGTVHQKFHLVPRLSLGDNVLTGALAQMPLWRSLLGLFPTSLRSAARERIEEVGLGDLPLDRRASALSGGQQQRVAIARALLTEPALVLADEPVASLDPESGRRVIELLKGATERRGATVLCSLHQVEFARMVADHIVALRGGRVLYAGSALGLDDALIAELYGPSEARP